MDSTIDFYETVPSFSRFGEVTGDEHYRRVPSDWVVVLTDVRGSTRAIEENRYKDVNMLGASSIVAVLNALKPRRVPFVFGGDGATLLMHRSDFERTVPALIATQKLARVQFNLEIRTGAVPVADLQAEGAEVEVAKFEMPGGGRLAMIRGGGLALAEKWIKSADRGPRFAVKPAGAHDGPDGDFEGLSCRWNPVPSRKGEIISLLVLATVPPAEAALVYTGLLVGIERILGDDPDSSPVTVDKLDRKMNFRNLAAEIKIQTCEKGLIARIKYAARAALQMIFLFRLMPLLGIEAGGFRAKEYVDGLAANADFRKFDDMLRMIRDCSPERRQALQRYLESELARGRIVYGLHVSAHALMTCLVFTADDHFHFIDGANGGYAMAAKQLKDQLARRGTRANA